MLTSREIRACGDRYRHEHENKQVQIPSYLTVNYATLDSVPDINLVYILGGGPFSTFDYYIKGGPDNGKRIVLAPWCPEWTLKGKHELYNGSEEEYNSCLGYPARPNIYCCVELHISTLMFIRGKLFEQRQHAMAAEIARLYEELDKQQ